MTTTRTVVQASRHHQKNNHDNNQHHQHHQQQSSHNVNTNTNYHHNSKWYQRYAVYPPYCSTPQEMAQRTIPPLSDSSTIDNTDSIDWSRSRLVHVTAVIRHGARTPYKGGLPCWKGYPEDPATGVWNCNLTTFVSPPPPDRVQQEEEEDESDANSAAAAAAVDEEGMFLFEKHYDALYLPRYNLSNILNGTCQEGQLILRGYEQEVTNGRHLRDAYVWDSSSSYHHNPRMRLFDVATHKLDQGDVYYRADDDQRTVMSGQLIFRGLFGPQLDAYLRQHGRYPVIALHTADRHRDILDPNRVICPRLTELQERFTASQDYQAFNESAETRMLLNFQREMLGVTTLDGKMEGGLDCLMTTICTDRPLPAALNDYTGGDESTTHDPPANDTDYSGGDMFLRLANYHIADILGPILANDAEFAKLAMGPLWAEILDNINGVLQQEAQQELPPEQRNNPPARAVPKLAIFSGHDTTLIPLLASLGVFDNKWPPYASEMVIEIHQLNFNMDTDDTNEQQQQPLPESVKQLYPTNYGFRLIYNGQILTPQVPGCSDHYEICNADVLVGLVDAMATRQRDCSRQHPIPVVYDDTLSRATELLSTSGGRGALVLIVLGSALFGAVGTYLYMINSVSYNNNAVRRPRRRQRNKYRRADEDEEEEADGIVRSNDPGSSDDDDDDNLVVVANGAGGGSTTTANGGYSDTVPSSSSSSIS